MVDNKLQIIIAEKPGIARKVACSLCPLYPCAERYCSKYNIDIFIHHFGRVDKYNHPISLLRCRSKQISHSDLPIYFSDLKRNNSNASLIYSSKIDGPGHTNLTRSLKEILFDWDVQKLRRPVMEQVDWYFINGGYKNSDWLIIHTGGNPQRLDVRKKTHRERKRGVSNFTFTSTDPKIVKSMMSHSAKHSPKGSSRMRLRFIAHLLGAKQLFKANVFVATDIDIAGTYIAATLPGFSSLSKGANVLRVALHDTTTEGIRDAINKATNFDWHNAEAGRLRDTVDYIIGRGFHDVMKNITRQVKFQIPFTIGRTRFLALDCLYRRWALARTWPENGDVYLSIIGLGDRDGVIDQLKKQAFLGVALKTSRGPFSPAGFLRELMYREVGTVSTRYTLLNKLIKQGLVRQESEWLIPTQTGIMVREQLIQHLENSSFSLWEWNHRINEIMVSAATNSDKSIKVLQAKTDKLIHQFMEEFLPDLLQSLPTLSLLLKRLYLRNKEINEPRAQTKTKGEIVGEYPPRFNICGLEGAADSTHLEKYIDLETNSFAIEKNIILKRGVPLPEIDWEGMLRRLLNIEREIGFSLIKGYNLERLPHLPEGMCTTFRAQCAVGELEHSLKRIKNSKGLTEDPIVLNVEEPTKDSALNETHEPLGLFDVTPGDVPGPDGFLVAAEYMRPYRYTLDLYKANIAQIELLESFKCGGLTFHRIHPFKYGTVNTFDTLLASMYDRHLMPFEKTAEIAEALYLSEGN